MMPTPTLPANLSAAGRAPRRTLLRLGGGAALLLAEAAALTPWVEFSGGAMQPVADARVCAAALVGHRRRARTARFALVLLAGPPLLYLLNAVRIFGLVVVGTSWSSRACVSLAHSRVAGALFLDVAAALISFALRPRGLGAAPRLATSGGG